MYWYIGRTNMEFSEVLGYNIQVNTVHTLFMHFKTVCRSKVGFACKHGAYRTHSVWQRMHRAQVGQRHTRSAKQHRIQLFFSYSLPTHRVVFLLQIKHFYWGCIQHTIRRCLQLGHTFPSHTMLRPFKELI